MAAAAAGTRRTRDASGYRAPNAEYARESGSDSGSGSVTRDSVTRPANCLSLTISLYTIHSHSGSLVQRSPLHRALCVRAQRQKELDRLRGSLLTESLVERHKRAASIVRSAPAARRPPPAYSFDAVVELCVCSVQEAELVQAAVCVFVRLLRALAHTADASRARSSRYVRHLRALTAALAHGLRAYAITIALLLFIILVLYRVLVHPTFDITDRFEIALLSSFRDFV